MHPPDAGTLDAHIRSGESRSTIVGSSLTLPISSGSTVAISTLSPSPHSRPSSTFSNMSTKAMITSLCSLALAIMKSDSTSMLTTFLLVRAFGASSISSCMVLLPMSSDFRSTFLASSMSLEIRTVHRLCRRLFRTLQHVTPLSLPSSRPIRSFQSSQTIFFIQTFPQNLWSIIQHTGGSLDREGLLSGGCTMFHPLLVNAFTSGFSSLLSKVQHHSR